MMQIYQGKSVFEGIAIGKIQVYQRREQQIRRYYVEDPEKQLKRLEQAKEEAERQLRTLRQKTVSEAGASSAAIFEAHILLLTDASYQEYIGNVIRNQMVNAEYGVCAAREYFSQRFSSMDDVYMRERAEDVKDVSDRLLGILTGRSRYARTSENEMVTGYEPVIMVADDFAPSETVQFDKSKILALVTVRGSVNSHTAILARTMNIPSVVSVPVPLQEADGHMAVVDGYSGCVYVDPDEDTLGLMEEKRAAHISRREQLFQLKGRESITKSGRKVRVCANIGNLEDLKSVMENDAEGIGLFRSECLYLGKDTYPTEEEQFQVYKAVAEVMAGKEVVIRTLDIGADKQAEYFGFEKEENPAMGCRAIRICLKRPEVFKTQLRAIFRAGAHGNVSVLYPMITSLREVRRIRALAEEVKQELTAEGAVYGEVKQGIMIETPAAAVISDLLAKEVDFFSIGTNDLTQYLLAVDRQNGGLDDFYDAHHEAVLRMIRLTVENAGKAGIPCGICGELAADEEITEELLRMGIGELSVSPGRILSLRKRIREMEV